MASRPLYRLERISTGGKVEAINNYHSKAEAERDAKAFRRYIKAAPLGNVWKYRVRRLTTAEATTSENPSSIRAQVRRLPSGQIQLKIPIGRSENPHGVIDQLKKLFGKRVKAVEMVGGKRKRNPSRGEVDEHASTELELFISSDSQLYRQQYQPILKNLATKRARGIYDHAKAVKLFMYLMETGAKKYAKEFAAPSEWAQIFSVPTRKAAAEQFAHHFEVEDSLGNYDNFLPKKYQKKA